MLCIKTESKPGEWLGLGNWGTCCKNQSQNAADLTYFNNIKPLLAHWKTCKDHWSPQVIFHLFPYLRDSSSTELGPSFTVGGNKGTERTLTKADHKIMWSVNMLYMNVCTFDALKQIHIYVWFLSSKMLSEMVNVVKLRTLFSIRKTTEFLFVFFSWPVF